MALTTAEVGKALGLAVPLSEADKATALRVMGTALAVANRYAPGRARTGRPVKPCSGRPAT